MTDESPPPPESCANNLYRAEDVSGKPVPSDLCRNALGVFHMLDCPLFLGRPCTFYEAGAAQREPADDLELERAARELRKDFLGWGYTLRVRGLTQPEGSVPARLAVEAIDEPEEKGVIRKRTGPDDDSAADVPEDEPDDEEPEETDEPRPEEPRVELYPGQRRSEERGRKKPRAGTAESPADDVDEAAEDEEPEEARPLTVDELLEKLPEAPLPDRPPAEERPRRSRRGGRTRGRSRGGRSGSKPRKEPGDGASKPEGGGGDRSRGGGRGEGGAGKGRRRRGRGRRSGGGDAKGAPGEAPKGGTKESKAPGGDAGGQQRGRRRRRRRGPPREGGGGGGSEA